MGGERRRARGARAAALALLLALVALAAVAAASARLEAEGECGGAGPAAAAGAGESGVEVCEADRAVTSSRVVAVADVHGDLGRLEQALELAGLVSEGPDVDARRWVGGDAVLVQTGDIMDRGPDTVRIFAWLARLRAEAAEAGGCVVQLLGNHELMNLAGDYRYADPEETAQFGGEAARRRDLAPGSALGDFLRSLPVVARVTQRDATNPAKDDLTTIFAHAGVPAWLATDRTVAEINAAARQLLDGASERQVQRLSVTNKLFLGQGLLWTRRFAEPSERAVCAELEETLAGLDAHRMLVGHTVQRTGRPTVRCGGRLVLADTGMSRAYGGGLSVVELGPALSPTAG